MCGRVCPFCGREWKDYYGDNCEFCPCTIGKPIPGRKKFAIPLNRTPASRLRKLYIKENGKCFYCGEQTVLSPVRIENQATVDHYIPTSRGGSNADSNRVLACVECNMAKGSMMPEEYMAKYSAPP